MCLPRFLYDEIPPNSSNLWRENRAAVTIQRSYRDHRHRKRQAAARKIQNFMRQSRIKLRKMHEQSAAGCTMEQEGVETEVGVLCLPGNQSTTQTTATTTMGVGNNQMHSQHQSQPQLQSHSISQTHQSLHHHHHHNPSLMPITIDHPMDASAIYSNSTPTHHPTSSLYHPALTGMSTGIVNLTMGDSNKPQQQMIQQQQQLTNNVISLQGDQPIINNMVHQSINQQAPLPPIHTIQNSNNNGSK